MCQGNLSRIVGSGVAQIRPYGNTAIGEYDIRNQNFIQTVLSIANEV